MKYNKMPLQFNGITEHYLSTASPYYSKSNPHKGLDLGWHDYQGEPVYSINDGTVLDVGKSTGSGNAGNYIWIKHNYDSKNDLLSRYCHLKDNSIKIKKGQKVTRGQQIASMGGTYGYATHLHFEMWKVPKNYSFNWNDRMKYLVDPLTYTFAFEDQKIGSDADDKKIIRVLGTSKIVKRDTTKNQIEVVGPVLRIRKGAGTNQTVLGYIDYGIYNYSETKTANGYTWYNLGFGWIAGTKEDTKVYPKEEQLPDTGKVIEENQNLDTNKKIEELQKEIESQKITIEEQNKKIEELSKELINCQNSSQFVANLKEFVADKEGYWKIYLKKDEKIYY